MYFEGEAPYILSLFIYRNVDLECPEYSRVLALSSEGSRSEDASIEGDTLMKRTSAIALLTFVTLAVATKLVAQEPAVKANIPFNFTVGDKSMPAGEYTISSPDRHLIEIKSTGGQNIELVVATQSFHESSAGSQLVFDKYGDYYFLHRILCPKISSLNLDVALGKLEKEVRTREAKLQTGKETLVAAR
jgi:hypothetical protein